MSLQKGGTGGYNPATITGLEGEKTNSAAFWRSISRMHSRFRFLSYMPDQGCVAFLQYLPNRPKTSKTVAYSAHAWRSYREATPRAQTSTAGSRKSNWNHGEFHPQLGTQQNNANTPISSRSDCVSRLQPLRRRPKNTARKSAQISEKLRSESKGIGKADSY